MSVWRRRPAGLRYRACLLALLCGLAGAGMATASPGSRAAGGTPAPLPLISRDAPAYTSDDCGSAYPARLADNDNYGDFWRSCAARPSAGNPIWLAYDLSAVPAAHRGAVVVAWYNDPLTDNYDHTIIATPAYNIPAAYTIEANPAPGGGRPPAGGWTALVSVAGNTYHSRQHALNLTGYNWLRMVVTASDGSARNDDVALNLDVHDAGLGAQDDWIFYGDSITAAAMDHDPRGVGTFAQLVAAQRPGAFPVQEDGGTGYLTSADGARLIGAWLNRFPGRYVALDFGTNDANGAAPGDPNVATTVYDHYATMVEAVIAAGKIPIVPTIPWARTPSVQANGPGINARLADLFTLYPQLLHGPDLWAYFQQHQDLISADNLHPTDQGNAAYRQQWASQMVATVYAGAAAPVHCFVATGRCVGDRFYAYWQAHGGLAINGYPISDVFTQTLDDGRPYQVQYFERVRMEYHPQNPPPYDVLLGQFGRTLHSADPPVAAQPGLTYFAATGHNVSDSFLAYWQANGGLAQFGYPLSEAFPQQLEDGKVYTVQYFERARFEAHPENPPPYDVELGQFGRLILSRTGR